VDVRGALAAFILTALLAADLVPPAAAERAGPAVRGENLYDELVLAGPASDWLAFAYTNKARSFLWQSTTGNSMSEFSGFNAEKFRVVDGWQVSDGLTQPILPPAEAYEFTPHRFVRTARGLSEEVFVPVGLNGFHLEYTTSEAVGNLVFSLFAETNYGDAFAWAGNTLVLKTYSSARASVAYVAITSDRTMTWTAQRGYEQRRYYFDEYRVGNSTWVLKTVWRAGPLELGPLSPGEHAGVAVAAAAQESDAIALARRILLERDTNLAARESRLRSLVSAWGLHASDPRMQRAYNFALTAMDNLEVAETFGPAIWAGLPWFNNGWGRDTFISLRGSMVADGEYGRARDVVRSFATFQQESDGRIPNLVPASGSPPYNTADATWWMILAIDEIGTWTGDDAFREEMFPVIAKAIDRGWAAYGDPADGLLRSAAKETWMDTSADPRVGKPVEVQALWIRALDIGIRFAEALGNATAAQAWRALSATATSSFTAKFWDETSDYLHDYLDATDAPVPRIRPNAFLAFSVLRDRVLGSGEWTAVASTALSRELLAPFGVRLIEPSDPLYRGNDTSTWDSPAYHNGDVWPWLAGPAAEVLAEGRRFEAVDSLLESMADDILSRDNLGTLPEILDGSDGEPKGTWTQAWSVAEFLRAVSQVVVGVRPEDPIRISPTPLAGNGTFSLPFSVRGERLVVNFTFTPGGQRLDLTGTATRDLLGWIKLPPMARGFTATVRLDGLTRTEEGHPGRTDYVTGLPFSRSASVEVAYERPWIELNSPRGGERFTGGDKVSIEWRTDVILPGDVVTAELSLTGDRKDWRPIARIEGASQTDWTVPDLLSSTARIRVRLATGSGEEVAAESGKFTIVPSPIVPPPSEPSSTVVRYGWIAAGAVVLVLLWTWWWRRRRPR